jgi:hypothetical protein
MSPWFRILEKFKAGLGAAGAAAALSEGLLSGLVVSRGIQFIDSYVITACVAGFFFLIAVLTTNFD